MIEAVKETQEIAAVHSHLDALSREQPGLADACAYYHRLLPILKHAQVEVHPLVVDPGKAQQKIALGEPVLRGEDLPFSSPQTASLFFRICDAISAGGEPGISPTQEIAASYEKLDLASLLYAALNGDDEPMQRAAQVLGLDGSLLQVILQNCLKPFLHSWQNRLTPDVDVSLWQKGQCPICGNLPILAELRGSQRARHLRCGLCGADWPFVRLQCAYCGNQSPHSLGVLQLERDPEKVTIQTCNVCHTYLKMVVTFEPILVDHLPVEDLSTLTLDMIAGNYGFTRPF